MYIITYTHTHTRVCAHMHARTYIYKIKKCKSLHAQK